MSERYLSELSESIAHLARRHEDAGLDRDDLDPDPLEQFAHWMEDALRAGIILPNTMTLATASEKGVPSARMVLLKGVDSGGFVFYSSYESPKARELAANPHAALVFYWSVLERQVRVTGPVTKVTVEESDHYFSTRTRDSRLGAWASEQSRLLEDRGDLERRVRDLEAKFAGEDVPRPPHWGGYRLTPETIEFWQGRDHRLHDRFLYSRGEREWAITRLFP